MKYLRGIIADYITQYANQMLPNAVGDIWLSKQFTPLFPGQGIQTKEIVSQLDSFEWETIADFTGECLIKIFTDENTPLDPSPLFGILVANPLIHLPTTNIPVGKKTLKFQFTCNGFADLINEAGTGIQPCIFGEIDGAILQRTPRNAPKPEDIIITTPSGVFTYF